jgi:hypothetical protein
MDIKRILAWAAAAVAILNAVVLALSPFLAEYPRLAPVLLVITSITALISPFLPRAQGTGK